jgi:hypothetical protein
MIQFFYTLPHPSRMYIRRSRIIEEGNGQVHLSDEDLSKLLHTIGQLAMYMAVMFMIYGVYLTFTLLAIYVLLWVLILLIACAYIMIYVWLIRMAHLHIHSHISTHILPILNALKVFSNSFTLRHTRSRGIRNSKPRLVLFIITIFEFLISTTWVILVLVFNAFMFLGVSDPTSEWYRRWTMLSTQFGITINFLVRLNVRRNQFFIRYCGSWRFFFRSSFSLVMELLYGGLGYFIRLTDPWKLFSLSAWL